jgi:hypothetical protein
MGKSFATHSGSSAIVRRVMTGLDDIVLFEILDHPLFQLLLAHLVKEFFFKRLK